MSSKSVIVHRTYDPIQAELLGDLLRDGGLAARVIGTRSGAAIGVGQVIMELHIEVPQDQAGQATDFLEAYFEQDGVQLLRSEGLLEDDAEDDEAAADAATREAQLRPLLAAGSVLLMFGGAHLYAKRHLTTLLIAVGQILAILNMFGGTWQAYITGVTMFGLLLVLDVIGGQFAVRSHNRGHRPSALSQLLVGALFVAIAGSIGAFVGPRVDQPKTKRDVSQVVGPAHIANAAPLG